LGSFPDLHAATLPLAGLGLAVGLVGTLLALGREGRGLAWTLPGSGVSLAVLVVAAFWPGLLRTIWPTSTPPSNGSQITSVPYGKQTGEGASSSADPEWIDASKRAAHQGDLRVRVVSVGVKPVLMTNFQPPQPTRENYLQI